MINIIMLSSSSYKFAKKLCTALV